MDRAGLERLLLSLCQFPGPVDCGEQRALSRTLAFGSAEGGRWLAIGGCYCRFAGIYPVRGNDIYGKSNRKKTVKTLLYCVIAAWALPAFTGFNLHAQVSTRITNAVTASLTITVQGSTTDDGTSTVYGKPTVMKLDTKTLLQRLAVDENLEGNYGSSTFPSKARLVLMNNAFLVVDRTGATLVDVSDLLSFSQGNIQVVSGKQNDASGAGSSTDLYIGTIVFNDSGVAGCGGINISVSGRFSEKQTISNPDKTGNQTESLSASSSDLVGEGAINGIDAVVTGSVSISGKGPRSSD
jgi:hypothetical protein